MLKIGQRIRIKESCDDQWSKGKIGTIISIDPNAIRRLTIGVDFYPEKHIYFHNLAGIIPTSTGRWVRPEFCEPVIGDWDE